MLGRSGTPELEHVVLGHAFDVQLPVQTEAGADDLIGDSLPPDTNVFENPFA
jgi:hypothetical protein